MIANGIQIKWSSGIEYIELDFEQLFAPNFKISCTRELWTKPAKAVVYYTRSEISIDNPRGLATVTIYYDEGSNGHLVDEGVSWGKSIIRIDLEKKEAKADYIAIGSDTYANGPGQCAFIDSGLFKEKKRATVTKTQREQDQFRKMLFSCEKVCVLTGEALEAVLVAAHIIPSKDGGAEVIQNGMLLRADIHCLYDAGYFVINPRDGSVEFLKSVNELPASYEQVLRHARLPQETLQRISKALAYVHLHGNSNTRKE